VLPPGWQPCGDPTTWEEGFIVHPVLFRIPGLDLPLHTYGVMIVTGFLLAMFVAWREAKRVGQLADEVLDVAFWCLMGGLIGARVVFIIVNWRQYFIDQFWDPEYTWLPSILVIWKGGLVFYGAALGGLAGFLLFCRRNGLDLTTTLRFADICVLGVPLAHVFGRFGCIAAGCCWGDGMFHFDGAQAVADIPFAARFPEGALAYSSLLGAATPEVADYMRETGHTVPLFPSQLAESIGESLVFLSLLFLRQRKWFHGQMVLTYFIAYPVLRSFLEMFRGDPERGYVIDGVLSTSQFISILVAACALIAIVILRKRGIARASSASPTT
jgi:phosphatidylglycerol:prolipoprotein diacylglycerol transferase